MNATALPVAGLQAEPWVPPVEWLRTGLESCGLATGDTAAVLTRLTAGQSSQDLSKDIAAGSLLSKKSRRGRDHLMTAVRRRYLSQRSPLAPVDYLAQGLQAITAPIARNQLLLPYLLSSDRAAYEVPVDWAATRRTPGGRITTADVVDQLAESFARHGRKPWGPSVSVRWAQGILSVLRDVGAVGRGRQRQEYLAYTVRPEVFAFHLWSLYDAGIRGSSLIWSTFWQLLLLNNQEDVRQAVRSVCERGWWRATAIGGVEELRPRANSMSDWLTNALG